MTLEKIYEILQGMQQGLQGVQKRLDSVQGELQELQSLRGLPQRFDAFEKEVNMRFARQFAYFDNRFKEIDKRFDTMPTRQQFDIWIARLDAQESKVSVQGAELSGLTTQARRHEKWIQKLAHSMAQYLKMS